MKEEGEEGAVKEERGERGDEGGGRGGEGVKEEGRGRERDVRHTQLLYHTTNTCSNFSSSVRAPSMFSSVIPSTSGRSPLMSVLVPTDTHFACLEVLTRPDTLVLVPISAHREKHSLYEQSLQEMLRKARQQQHNRKAKQHNTTCPKQSFFKEKLAASGGTQTHDHQLSRRRSYQLSYRGSSAGWAKSCIQISIASQPDKQVNSNLVFIL